MPDYAPIASKMIDFPVSWGWWRHYCIYFDNFDPGTNEPPDNSELNKLQEEVEEIKNLASSEKWQASQWDYIKQLKGQVVYLQKKVITLEDIIGNTKTRKAIGKTHKGYEL